jgi:hypothetical protein
MTELGSCCVLFVSLHFITVVNEEWKGWYEIFIRFACVVIVSMIGFKKSVFI